MENIEPVVLGLDEIIEEKENNWEKKPWAGEGS